MASIVGARRRSVQEEDRKHLSHLEQQDVEAGSMYEAHMALLQQRRSSALTTSRSSLMTPFSRSEMGSSTVVLVSEEHSVVRGTRESRRGGIYLVSEHAGNISSGTCQIPAKRDQDRYIVHLSDQDQVAVPHAIGVFDGHGTSVFAADLCTQRLLSQIYESSIKSEEHKWREGEMIPNEAIIQGFLKVDKMVGEVQHIIPRTGTCASILLVETEAMSQMRGSKSVIVKCAWVGDSRVVMCGKGGKEALALSVDHRASSNAEEVSRIESSDLPPRDGLLKSRNWANEKQLAEEMGTPLRANSFVGQRSYNGVNAGPLVVFAYTGGVSLQITRTIGDKLAARSCIAVPEINTIEIPRDQYARFVIASDGVWDVLSSADACMVMRKEKNPARAARALALAARNRRARKRLGEDDITVSVLDINAHLLDEATPSEPEQNKESNMFQSRRDISQKERKESGCGLM